MRWHTSLLSDGAGYWEARWECDGRCGFQSFTTRREARAWLSEQRRKLTDVDTTREVTHGTEA